MNNINEIIALAEKQFKLGQLALGNGFKQSNNVCNNDFILIVKHFHQLLSDYVIKHNESNELVLVALDDLNYGVDFLTKRWSHKKNAEVPKKFMVHNPLCRAWRKRLDPGNAEMIVIANSILAQINANEQV